MTDVSRSDDMTTDGKGAMAIASQLTDANLVDITGPIRINYSSSRIRGVPLVSYKDADPTSTSRTARSPAARPPWAR